MFGNAFGSSSTPAFGIPKLGTPPAGNTAFGFGQQNTTSTPAPSFGGFGAGNTATTPANASLFGTTATATPAFSGFLATSSTNPSAPAFGGFGKPANSAISTGGFGAFGQTAQQPQPSLTSFGNFASGGSGGLGLAVMHGFVPQQTVPTLLDKFKEMESCWNVQNPNCQFKHYFYNIVPQSEAQRYSCPPGHDITLYQQAMQDNPNPQCMVPVLAVGFDDIRKRLGQQEVQNSAHRAKLQELASRLEKIERKHHLETTVKLAEYKRRHIELAQRVLKIMKFVYVLRNKGTAIGAKEEAMRSRLEAMDLQLKKPAHFRGRLQELQATLRMLKDSRRLLNGSSSGTSNDENGVGAVSGLHSVAFQVGNEEQLRNIGEALLTAQEGLRSLTGVLEEDDKNLEIMLNGYHYTQDASENQVSQSGNIMRNRSISTPAPDVASQFLGKGGSPPQFDTAADSVPLDNSTDFISNSTNSSAGPSPSSSTISLSSTIMAPAPLVPTVRTRSSTGPALSSFGVRKKQSFSTSQSTQSNRLSLTSGLAEAAAVADFTQGLGGGLSPGSITSISPSRSASNAMMPGESPRFNITTVVSDSGLLGRMSFAEFKLQDSKRRRQRHVLHALIAADVKVKVEEKNDVDVSRKPFKEPKFKDDKKGFMKLGGLLQKKKKKRTRSALFHLLHMAILDRRNSLACVLLEDISSATLRRKQQIWRTLAGRIFIGAMINGMEPVCMVLLEKGFPISVNAPAFEKSSGVAAPHAPSGASAIGKSSGNSSSNSYSTSGSANGSTLEFPSYFMVSVGLGLENVARAMIKRADVNQTWHGLTALHITAARNALGLVQILIESGANPGVGIHLSQYALFRRLKSFTTTSKLSSLNSASSPTSTMSRKSGTGWGVSTQQVKTIPGAIGGSGEMEVPAANKKKKQRFSEEYLKGKKILPVEIAAACGHVEMFKLLLSRTDPKYIKNCSVALLVQRHVEMTVRFIRAGVSVSQTDQNGSQAMHLGCRAGDLEYVVALVECGADLNSRGQNNWTPLHEAISQRRIAAAKFLVRRGADVNAVNATGETPRDLGLKAGMTATDLDQCLEKSRFEAAVPDWEHDVINQVKFIRYTSDHGGGMSVSRGNQSGAISPSTVGSNSGWLLPSSNSSSSAMTPSTSPSPQKSKMFGFSLKSSKEKEKDASTTASSASVASASSVDTTSSTSDEKNRGGMFKRFGV